jgi:hypothetical protein
MCPNSTTVRGDSFPFAAVSAVTVVDAVPPHPAAMTVAAITAIEPTTASDGFMVPSSRPGRDSRLVLQVIVIPLRNAAVARA